MFQLDGVQRYIVIEWRLKNVNHFLLGFCDPLGINNGHQLSSNFQIYLGLCKCVTKHRYVSLAKLHFVNSRTKETQYSLKSRV